MSEIKLQDAVKKFARDLAEKVNTFVADVTVLEVRTFTVPHDQVTQFVSGQPDVAVIATEGNVALRAYTQVMFDGDTTVCVPVTAEGEVDKTLWALHQETVAQAMENRSTMLKAVGEAAASGLKALGLANE